eukprot:8689588-Pyramimonas_sp.AAC.1
MACHPSPRPSHNRQMGPPPVGESSLAGAASLPSLGAPACRRCPACHSRRECSACSSRRPDAASRDPGEWQNRR